MLVLRGIVSLVRLEQIWGVSISRPWSQVGVRIAWSSRPWMRRVSSPDLVGFTSQGQSHDDQVAGGALNQGCAHVIPLLSISSGAMSSPVS